MDLERSYFTVASNSMQPTLSPGDKITIEPIDPEDIVPGMVVVYRSGDRKIVHRVVRKKGFILVTAGDSLRKYDNPIHVYDVIGKVKGLKTKKALSKCSRLLRAVKRRVF
jgi:signal peptidase I